MLPLIVLLGSSNEVTWLHMVSIVLSIMHHHLVQLTSFVSAAFRKVLACSVCHPSVLGRLIVSRSGPSIYISFLRPFSLLSFTFYQSRSAHVIGSTAATAAKTNAPPLYEDRSRTMADINEEAGDARPHLKTGCKDYCCSDFARFKDDPAITPCNLTNDISPLFHPNKFAAGMDYSALDPVLRLATLLLQSRALTEYTNTVSYGNVHDADGSVVSHTSTPISSLGKQVLSIWPDKNSDWTPSEATLRAKEALEHDLEELLTFDLLEDGVSDLGQCKLAPRNPPDAATLVRHCKISLNYKRFEELVSLTAQEKASLIGPKDAFRLLELRFATAQTIIHEIGHALQFAHFPEFRGSYPRELHYRDSKVSEAGLEIVGQLFGGKIIKFQPPSFKDFPEACAGSKSHRPSASFCFDEHPSLHRHNDYQLRGEEIWHGIKDKAYDVHWRVPAAFIASLFTDEFWADQAKRNDPKGLHPPRDCCWSFAVSGNRRCPLSTSRLEKDFEFQRAPQLCSPSQHEGADTPEKSSGKRRAICSMFLPRNKTVNE